MAKPCSHRRRVVSGYCACSFEVAGFVCWRVQEDMKCVKCGDVTCRWSRKGYGARTARDALKRYGVLPADLPPPANHKPKTQPLAVRTTGWPFPVSAHTEPA
jgi:hypothetical protein